jgi:hypothetical protein
MQVEERDFASLDPALDELAQRGGVPALATLSTGPPGETCDQTSPC